MNRFLVLLVTLPIFVSCTTKQKFQPIEQTRLLMDTIVQIVVYDNQIATSEITAIINKAFDRIKHIEELSNFYSDSSQLSFVNQNAAVREIEIDTSLAKMIAASLMISELTDGCFDITIGRAKELWQFDAEQPEIPDMKSVKKILPFVNYKLIRLRGNKIKFLKRGVKIDLGAIAKGYAVDEAMQVLQQHGIRDALVNAGGNLRAICSDLTRGKRKIWIKHPRQPEAFFANFPMDDGSVATSGDYERYFIKDSLRYHHILNPKTGYPVRACVSVTIQAANAMLADALGTAVFVLGPEQGMIFVNSLPRVKCLILVEKNNQLSWNVSNGFINLNFINSTN